MVKVPRVRPQVVEVEVLTSIPARRMAGGVNPRRAMTTKRACTQAADLTRRRWRGCGIELLPQELVMARPAAKRTKREASPNLFFVPAGAAQRLRGR